MLAASNRLRDRRAIAEVMRRGRPVTVATLFIKLRPNHLPNSRALIVVSKKVAKKAVVRNRIRRRMAAILAEDWATVPPGYDIVITVRTDMAELPPTELKRAIAAALQQANMRTKP